MLDKVIEINELLNKQRYYTLKEAKDEISSKAAGFYWIYTKLPIERFLEAPTPTNSVHIDLSLISRLHKDLEWIIKQGKEDYWCIYNGKGTELKKRMSAGFTNTPGGTGKLALTRCFEENDFRVKFIVCDSKNTIYGIDSEFSDLKLDLERTWRLNFGWPMLCRT
ncbi:hypothetical protein [Photobacterium minamisatsumaniensis]|uniref:hypothetical protein n=1 Tax=Photobacterium minamisatsumaniensis TaxID=2910233 RepID=UPI003D099655